MPRREGPLRVEEGLEIPSSELTVESARSGGPGGQNVNKVATKVVLRFSPQASSALDPEQKERIARRLSGRMSRAGEIVLHVSAHRARSQNLREARERLAEILRRALVRPKPRRPTRPTRASKERRLAAKRKASEAKRARRPPLD